MKIHSSVVWHVVLLLSFWRVTLSFSVVPKDHSSPTRKRSHRDAHADSNEYFIRPALKMDMDRASWILTEGFYKDRTNFITYQWERLQTLLSLESSFPKEEDPHELLVACHSERGEVLGLAEVDYRSKSHKLNCPYMCNLASDPKWQRKGIATALIQACEDHVQEVWGAPCMYLKVRETNTPAVSLYRKLGYQVVASEMDQVLKGDVLLVLHKEFSKETCHTAGVDRHSSEAISCGK